MGTSLEERGPIQTTSEYSCQVKSAMGSDSGPLRNFAEGFCQFLSRHEPKYTGDRLILGKGIGSHTKARCMFRNCLTDAIQQSGFLAAVFSTTKTALLCRRLGRAIILFGWILLWREISRERKLQTAQPR